VGELLDDLGARAGRTTDVTATRAFATITVYTIAATALAAASFIRRDVLG
jgi:hypothetical protein